MADPAAFVPFDPEGGLVFATALPGGPGDFAERRRSWDALGSLPGAALWVHLDRTRQRAQAWLRTESGVAEPVVDALLAEDTRPVAVAIEDGLLVILRGVDMNPGAEPDELISIRMWFQPGRAITLRQYRFQTVAQLRAAAQRGEAPRSVGELLAAIAEGLSERMNPSVENLESMLDEIEQRMLDGPDDDPQMRTQLASIRRQAITLRRYLVPQRDALLHLSLLTCPLLTERDRVELRVSADRVARVAEALEELRDRAAVTHEELRARHEARMGRTLYLLTIVATIALPMGIITGLLGINVGGVPMANSPAGFAVVCLALVALAAVELALFRALRWI
ncbi:MAG: zinc transporter ZntB [Phycisphaerales bacterium JB039]